MCSKSHCLHSSAMRQIKDEKKRVRCGRISRSVYAIVFVRPTLLIKINLFKARQLSLFHRKNVPLGQNIVQLMSQIDYN